MKKFALLATTLTFAAAMSFAQSSSSSGATSTDQQTSGATSNTTGTYSQDANQNANSGDTSSQQSTDPQADGKQKKKTHKDNGTTKSPSDNKGVMGGDSAHENTSSPVSNSSHLPGQKVSHPPDSNSQSSPQSDNPHF